MVLKLVFKEYFNGAGERVCIGGEEVLPFCGDSGNVKNGEWFCQDSCHLESFQGDGRCWAERGPCFFVKILEGFYKKCCPLPAFGLMCQILGPPMGGGLCRRCVRSVKVEKKHPVFLGVKVDA